jgi:hypothetical protein
MSTDPLSEEHRPRFSSPRMDSGASRGWQACARRAKEENSKLEAYIRELHELIKILSERKK